MNEYLKVNLRNRTYKAITFLLLILSIFTIQNNNHNNQFQFIVIIVSLAIAILGFIEILFSGLTFQKIIFNLLIVVILFIFKFNNFLVIPACLAIAFINYSPELVVHSYYISSIWNLIVTCLTAIVGFGPMFNSSDGVLTLGYSNENSFGLVITFLALLFYIQLKLYKSRTNWFYIKIVFIFLTLFIDYFVIDDKTMFIVFIAFVVLSILLKSNKLVVLILVKFIGIILPFSLLYLSWLFTKDFGSMQNSFKINEIMSNRLYMWNWYYQKMGVSFLPPSLHLSGFDFWGTIDGSYTLFLLQYGVCLTILVTILLAICNYLLYKNNKYILFSLMLSFELGAFCENILQFYTLTFVLIFAICSIYPGWGNRDSNLMVI